MRSLAVGAVLALALTGAAIADPIGTYAVKGTNPDDGSGYTGSVVVSRTGDTYSVIWTVGGQKFVGTGIGDKDFIAVTYRSGSDTGLALYSAKGANWDGIWTYAGGKKIGTESWQRR